MNDATKASLLSAFRSILAVVGGILVSHGFINDAQMNEVLGAIMVIIPIVWGVVDKLLTEKKAAARETAAANAAVLSATGKYPALAPSEVKQIVQDNPAPAQGGKP